MRPCEKLTGKKDNKPVRVEFLGTPEAGKTTTIQESAKIFNQVCNTIYVQEAAELRPSHIPKRGMDANWWIRLKGIMDLIESKHSGYDLVLLDRGIVDAMFWNDLFVAQGRITADDRKAANHFFEMLNQFPDLCFVFKISPEEAIKRRGGEGTIVTLDFIRKYNEQLDNFLNEFTKKHPEIPVYIVDTMHMTQEEVANFVESKILEYLNL